MFDGYSNIIKYGNTISESEDSLVIMLTSNTSFYGMPIIRSQPVVIVNNAITKSLLHKLPSALSSAYSDIKLKNVEYDVRMSNKIPKKYFIKNNKIELFHISENPNIKELEPRITTKRLSDENIRIARVSAAPSIDECFKAVGFTLNPGDKPKTYYCYQILLPDNARIVKPSLQMVPDQDYTNEYWILDPVKVKLLGSITISLDKKTNNYIFDDSKMPK